MSQSHGSSLNHADHANLLLGWRRPAPEAPFGFGRSEPAANQDQPIEYGDAAHLITVAPTRSGKGRGVIVPNLLHYRGPAVILDPKGELYQVTARARRDMGQRVVRLDPFLLLGPGSDSFNLLDVFKLPGADLGSESQMLAHLMCAGSLNAREPFWDLNGCGLLAGVLSAVASIKEPPERNLNEVCRMLSCDDVIYQLAVFLDTVGEKLEKHARQEIASFLQMPEITRGGVLATVESYLKPLTSQRVEAVLGESTFPFEDVMTGAPMSIYMILPPDKLQSHKGLLKLWVGTLLKAITTRTEVPALRTLFLLDEAGQLGNFPFLETMITLSAGYGVWCWSFWQDLSQLKSAYPTSWENILNNCGVVQTFGIHNRNMAQQWGQFLGHDADALAALQPAEQVLSIHGEEEQRGRRMDYLADACFAGRFDENRFFRRTNQMPPKLGPGPDSFATPPASR